MRKNKNKSSRLWFLLYLSFIPHCLYFNNVRYFLKFLVETPLQQICTLPIISATILAAKNYQGFLLFELLQKHYYLKSHFLFKNTFSCQFVVIYLLGFVNGLRFINRPTIILDHKRHLWKPWTHATVRMT